jgi:hypothetical protein
VNPEALLRFILEDGKLHIAFKGGIQTDKNKLSLV